eukprot:CAMPEP_0115221684 /NCGR_PEP_ID=MMETSP0270-20121206/28097_1 /TAXON_ID=71861 /ORGANISM="Scrippsiella trochoidea, Strain CCMP3099" /LENGTH=74 /DNA_ID=CAMNT_0002635793 /DNA_START=46 /DNA_END=266 /DNA_ORIENTATION=-
MVRLALVLPPLLFLGVPSAAYVVPGTGLGSQMQSRVAAASTAGFPDLEEAKVEPQEASVIGLAAASLGVGAVLG